MEELLDRVAKLDRYPKRGRIVREIGEPAYREILQEPYRMTRRITAALHGLGIFLILLGGFGMLARLGLVRGSSWPGWVWVKLMIWVILGLAAFLPYRFPRTSLPLLFLLPVLGGLAAYMAIYKPL